MKNMLKSLFIFLSIVSGPLCASYTFVMDFELANLCLHLFVVQKNTIRVERYGLHEIAESMNHISNSMSNEHCTHIMHVGERGLHVEKVRYHATVPNQFVINAFRGSKKIDYSLCWSKIVMNDESQADPCMLGHVEISNPQKNNVSDRAANMECCDVAVTWGLENKRTVHLMFDHEVDSAVAFIMPNCLCKNISSPTQILKRNELIEQGLLSKVQPQELHMNIHDESSLLRSHNKNSMHLSHRIKQVCAKIITTINDSVKYVLNKKP